jgi:ABC-type transporter Mla MlaB component
MFYIARNTLAVTGNMTKKAALALWEANKSTEATDGAQYQLCKDTGSINPVVVMDLV